MVVLEQPKVQPNASNWPQNLIVSSLVLFCLLLSVLLNYLSVHDPGPFKAVFLLLRYSPFLFYLPFLDYLPMFSVLLILPAFTLSGAIFFDALANVSRLQNRVGHKEMLLNSGILCLLCLVALLSLQVVRHHGFAALSERSKSLIAAISAYEKQYSKAPENLDQLVPEFLSNVPDTGMGSYPNYEYRAFSGLACGAWSLRVPCYLHPVNGDEFSYSPHSKNLGNIPGGYNEQIGDWVYFHE